MAAAKYVYFFGDGKAEGKAHQRELLGGKGAGLAEMTSIGLPVPAGFTITTECCDLYYRGGKKWPRGLDKQVRASLTRLEKLCGKKLGDAKDPLLVSVRSGADRSMPGMMETILNLGLNDASAEGLARASGNRRFALDAYRRLICMYGSTAIGVPRQRFEEALIQVKEGRTRGRLGRPAEEPIPDTDVNAEELAGLIARYKEIYREHTGQAFPQDPKEQLAGAINAVFESWMAGKAVTYRRVEKLTGMRGTAVNVQHMVFGNMGEDSGSGVCFTRDPSTGANVFYGDFLYNAQGEDVVAGIRTPSHLADLKDRMPEIYAQLEAVRAILELHYLDMQDLEFTIERGKLYMLQCRTGKRAPTAVFRIALEQATKPLLTRPEIRRLVRAGYLPRRSAERAARPVLTKAQAVARIEPADIERLFHPVIDPRVAWEELEAKRLADAIGAVPGAAAGEVVFSARAAEALKAEGRKAILVRKETSPEDVGGMFAAQGILTATGGKTSHAAVVARGWGKCCIVGCEGLKIDYGAKRMIVHDRLVREHDRITLDGGLGVVFDGELPLIMPEPPPEYHTLMSWCDRMRRLRVRANADTPADAAKAVQMGAEGIGLCRTEHMFFKELRADLPPEETARRTQQRQLAIQEMIVADTEAHRRRALEKLLPFQRDDFYGIFEAMDGRPVTIRLIDPPLHEFLPKTPEQFERLSSVTGIPVEAIIQRAELLTESNPMLGHRGCRLCITYPEILDMQVRAVMEAAARCKQAGKRVAPEIMIPLSIDREELRILIDRTRCVVHRVFEETGVKIPYLVGTMIETPRAALLANELAEVCDFFSFGTNDLTQLTMSISRDDSGHFLPAYVDPQRAGAFRVFNDHPFQTLDQKGVGLLVEMGIKKGRSTRPKLKIGICGEHGGELASVEFCHRVGMDYVSCSPYRVPIARLAAAKAALKDKPRRKATAKRVAAGAKRRSRKLRRRPPVKKRPARSRARARRKTRR